MILGLIIVGLIIIFYAISKKEKLSNLFSDTYESMIYAITKNSDKSKNDPEKIYNGMVGYEKNDIIKKTSTKLKKREKLLLDHERRGKLTKNKINEAVTNSFMLGDIYRFSEMENAQNELERVRAIEMAGDYYMRTMNRIRNNPVDTIIGNEIENGPTIDMMIDRADEFFQVNDDLPVNIEINFNDLRDTMRDARAQAYLGNHVAPRTSVKKRPLRKPNQTVKQFTQEQFYEPKNIRSDAQNVHEPQVSNSISQIYTVIKHENDKEDMLTGGLDNRKNLDLGSIKQAVTEHNFTDEPGRQRALSVLETMSKGGEVTVLHDNEKNILLNVWRRIHSGDNSEQREFLKDAFMDSLSNGMEKNYYGDYAMVCANGRCDRVINSLTLIDSNPLISKPIKTKEIMRNEILSKSYSILQDELKRAPTNVAKAYNGSLSESQIDADLQNQVDVFVNNVKDKIETQIREDYKESDVRGETTLDNLIKDAQSGV